MARWNQAEIEILKKYSQPINWMPPKELHENYLPYKNIKAIDYKRSVLDLSNPIYNYTKQQPWSEEETLILEQNSQLNNWVDATKLVNKYLPNRSHRSIIIRRTILGLNVNNPRNKKTPPSTIPKKKPRRDIDEKWTEEEIEILKKFSVGNSWINPVKLIKYLPRKSEYRITKKRKDLGLSHSPRMKYKPTQVELDIIKKYSTWDNWLSAWDLKDRFIPDIGIYSLNRIRKDNNLFPPHHWSQEEIVTLLKFSTPTTWVSHIEMHIRYLPNHTTGAIADRRESLGIYAPQYHASSWTEDEEKILIEYSQPTNWLPITRLLTRLPNRTFKSIEHKRKYLHLFKS